MPLASIPVQRSQLVAGKLLIIILSGVKINLNLMVASRTRNNRLVLVLIIIWPLFERLWGAMAERFSASDLCSDGRVVRM